MSAQGVDRRKVPTRALLVLPTALDREAAAARLDEAYGLCLAIDLDVRHQEVVRLDRPRPGTYMAHGAIERLAEVIEVDEIEVAIVDASLSPTQQRNLEQALNAKVIDRTGLILEIFGERARTKEGQLQVDLAQLSYQRSRLVRSWTHLERQRGGAGFMGGPGERQIELDRRLLDERIVRLKKELEEVKRTRGLHREGRKRVPYPIVALVGYTNAGKSTLFNRLTEAKVLAKDMLFATLDPTMRRVVLPSGREVIFSDTVGFISELPHQLVAAFQATLEEVLEANVIIHLRDLSHPDTAGQRQSVLSVLRELGINTEEETASVVLEVGNKIDLLEGDEKSEAISDKLLDCCVSAVTGEGLNDLLSLVEDALQKNNLTVFVELEPGEGALLAWLYEHGDVRSRSDDESGIHLEVSLDPINLARFEQKRATSP